MTIRNCSLVRVMQGGPFAANKRPTRSGEGELCGHLGATTFSDGVGVSDTRLYPRPHDCKPDSRSRTRSDVRTGLRAVVSMLSEDAVRGDGAHHAQASEARIGVSDRGEGSLSAVRSPRRCVRSSAPEIRARPSSNDFLANYGAIDFGLVELIVNSPNEFESGPAANRSRDARIRTADFG